MNTIETISQPKAVKQAKAILEILLENSVKFTFRAGYNFFQFTSVVNADEMKFHIKHAKIKLDEYKQRFSEIVITYK